MRTRTRLTVPLIVAGLVLAVLVPGASAAKPVLGGKYYAAVLSPDVVPRGQSTLLQLRNCPVCPGGRSSTQPFASAEVRLPVGSGVTPSVSRPGWTTQPAVVVGGLSVWQLISSGTGTTNAVQPGDALDVTLTAAADAPVQDVTVGTAVKQSNDFSGAGNEFASTTPDPVLHVGPGPAHHLVFDVQPSDVQSSGSSLASTGVVPVRSMCAPPQVRVVDALGATVTAPRTVTLEAASSGLTLGGVTSVPTTGGVATFGTCGTGVTSTSLGSGWRVNARSTGLPDLLSGTFNVLTSYGTCAGACSVSGLTGAKKTTAAVQATPGASATGAERLSFTTDTWATGLRAACGSGLDTDNPERDPVMVDFAEHAKSVDLRWTKKAVQWATNNGSSQWRVCLAAAYEFNGSTAVTDNGATWYVGILQQCGTPGLPADDPCVTNLRRTAGGEQLATVVMPDRPGDPRMI